MPTPGARLAEGEPAERPDSPGRSASGEGARRLWPGDAFPLWNLKTTWHTFHVGAVATPVGRGVQLGALGLGVGVETVLEEAEGGSWLRGLGGGALSKSGLGRRWRDLSLWNKPCGTLPGAFPPSLCQSDSGKAGIDLAVLG